MSLNPNVTENGDELYWAAFHGNVDGLVSLILAGHSPRYVRDLPLRWAVANGHSECSLILLIHGAEDLSWCSEESCEHKSIEPCTHMLQRYSKELIGELALTFIVTREHESYTKQTRKHVYKALCEYANAHGLTNLLVRLKYTMLRLSFLRENEDVLIPETYFSKHDQLDYYSKLKAGVTDGVNREYGRKETKAYSEDEQQQLSDVVASNDAEFIAEEATENSAESDFFDEFRNRLKILDSHWRNAFHGRYEPEDTWSKAECIRLKDALVEDIFSFLRAGKEQQISRKDHDSPARQNAIQTQVEPSMEQTTQTERTIQTKQTMTRTMQTMELLSPKRSVKRHVALPTSRSVLGKFYDGKSPRFAQITRMTFTFQSNTFVMLEHIKEQCYGTWLYDVNIQYSTEEEEETCN